jgi:hypothetical protein
MLGTGVENKFTVKHVLRLVLPYTVNKNYNVSVLNTLEGFEVPTDLCLVLLQKIIFLLEI